MNERAVNQRPKSVVLAVQLQVFSLSIHLIIIILAWIHLYSIGSNKPTDDFTGCALGFTLWVTIIYKTYKGKNWARILYLVLVIIQLLVAAYFLIYVFHNSMTIGRLIAITAILLGIPPSYLLFSGSGAAWFRSQKKGKTK